MVELYIGKGMKKCEYESGMRRISGVDLLEIKLKGSIVALYPYHGHFAGF